MGQVLIATARLEAAVERLEATVARGLSGGDESATREELATLQTRYAHLEKRAGTVALRLDKAIARLQKVLEA